MVLAKRARKYFGEQMEFFNTLITTWINMSIEQKESTMLEILENLMTQVNEEGIDRAKREHEFIKWSFKQAKGKRLETKLDAMFNQYIAGSLEVLTLKVS